jgi:SagB-type dehydrogenase family enzyme
VLSISYRRKADMDPIEKGRRFLRSESWDEWRVLETDQRKQVPVPPVQKPCPEGTAVIDLVPREEMTVGTMPVINAIGRRESRRKFTSETLSREELSFLLWATQGVRQVFHTGGTRRTVPSGGSRHPFETYLVVSRVEGLEPGLYRYQPLEHQLCLLGEVQDVASKITEGCHGQSFAGEGAVIFIWTVIPYRTEWRYSHVSHKAIAMDSGHLCQNLYIACEAIGAGTCAIGAYDQAKMDAIIGVDGKDEFTIYVAPVGKVQV